MRIAPVLGGATPRGHTPAHSVTAEVRLQYTPPADEKCTSFFHPISCLFSAVLSFPPRPLTRVPRAMERFRVGSLRDRAPQTRSCVVNGDRRRRVRAQYDRGALRRGRRIRDLGAYSGRVDGAPSRALFRESRALMRNAPVLRGPGVAARTYPGRCMSTNL
jgi:hypothetical protein